MMYTLRREIEVGDRPGIDQVLFEIEKANGSHRDLIRLIVLSERFLTH